MKIIVVIRDLVTEERRIYKDTYEWKEYPEHYTSADAHVLNMYEDGNYGCDCNRSAFFWEAGEDDGSSREEWNRSLYEAAGEEYEEDDLDSGPCGETRFVVDGILDAATGRIIINHDPRTPIRP